MKLKTTTLFLSIAIPFAQTATAQLPPWLPSNGLVAWYPFNGNATDESQNTHDGVVVGALSTTDRFGTVNSAYAFPDGMAETNNCFCGSRIEVQDAVDLRLAGTDYTLSAWCYLNDLLPTSVGYGGYSIASKRGFQSGEGYHFAINAPGNDNSSAAGLAVCGFSGGGDPRAYSQGVLSLHQWVNVTYVYTVADQHMRIYLDGVLNSTTTGIPSPNPNTTANLWLGNDVSGSPYHFHGALDDIAMYNRALTNAEITTIHNGGTVVLTLNTDANANQTTWSIVNSGTTTSVCSGGGYANSSTVIVNCCLPNGCYDLRVFDSFGDGINPGGYVLRDANNNRIIDNANNGAGFTTLSEVRNTSNVPVSFCVPTGTDALVSGCDQENLLLTSVIQVGADPAVTAQYGVSNATSGYQFWVFNPNGGYSRRLFLSHAAPGSGYPVATPANVRATWFKLSAMSSAPAIPQFTLLNVRVRSRVNGVDGQFGPACRIKIDPLANCATTQLTTTATPIISCGAANVSRSSGVLWSNIVGGANKYQFEFVNANTNILLRKIASGTRDLHMSTWGTSVPLPACNVPYNMRVRVSFDGGANYCAFGPVCQVTFSCGPADNREAVLIPEVNDALQLYPNPTTASITIEGITADLRVTPVQLIDAQGRVVPLAPVKIIGSGSVALDLTGLPDGPYMLRIGQQVQRIIKQD